MTFAEFDQLLELGAGVHLSVQDRADLIAEAEDELLHCTEPERIAELEERIRMFS